MDRSFRLRPVAVQCLLAALFAASSAAAQDAQGVPQRLGTVRLNAGIHNIEAEVAQSPAERSIGLMHRREMPTNHGMLFAFERPGVQCFWMKNTLLPLSIAFLADDGTIVNVADMKPETTDSHCSSKAVRYALEMNQGWFAKRGLQSGAKLSGEPFGR